jgi:hypothetical protein
MPTLNLSIPEEMPPAKHTNNFTNQPEEIMIWLSEIRSKISEKRNRDFSQDFEA